MTQERLCELYDEIVPGKIFSMPMKDFEGKWAEIKISKKKNIPLHATVQISLLGTSFQYPENYLVNDIGHGLTTAKQSEKELHSLSNKRGSISRYDRGDLKSTALRNQFASRSCVLSCFNLIEAYLNGIAWDFLQEKNNIIDLSNNKMKLLKGEGNDAKFLKKLIKYPEIIGGGSLWNERQEPVKSFLLDVKPLRDSLVHPSPFSAPEKFGGYDKLSKFYEVDTQCAENAAKLTVEIIVAIHKHITDANSKGPAWLVRLKDQISESEVYPLTIIE